MKLNLGSGQNPLPGYINVDKFGSPDLLHDLEKFPYPWETNSIDEIVMHHILEHLGERTETFLGIIKELYRICKPDALIKITVPHPRHDAFISDPTHVRIINPSLLQLFSKKFNQECKEKKAANTPLGLYLDVDFEIIDNQVVLAEPYNTDYQNGLITTERLNLLEQQLNNVVAEYRITLIAIK